MTVEQIVKALMRLARMDSGLPDDLRDTFFNAYCLSIANWDAVAESLAKDVTEESQAPSVQAARSTF